MSTILHLTNLPKPANPVTQENHKTGCFGFPCAQLTLMDAEGAVIETESWQLLHSLTIGRSGTNIEIPLPEISRQHLKVVANEGQYSIQDLGSRNGTALNGRFIDQEIHALKDGDQIVLAGRLSLVFTDPLTTPLAPRIGKLKGLWLDLDSQRVWFDACQLQPSLSARQFALLRMLHDANGELISRDDIIRHIWPNTALELVSNDAVDSLVKRLRKRLAELTTGSPVIEARRGSGLQLGKAHVTPVRPSGFTGM